MRTIRGPDAARNHSSTDALAATPCRGFRHCRIVILVIAFDAWKCATVSGADPPILMVLLLLRREGGELTVDVRGGRSRLVRTRGVLAWITAVACWASVGVAVPALAAPRVGEQTPKPSPGRAVSGVKPMPFRFTAPRDAAGKTYRPQATRWPRSATSALKLIKSDGKPTGTVRAAGTPVWARPVTAGNGYQGPAQAVVQVLDQQTTQRTGVAGVLVKVAPKGQAADRVRIGVDYADFAEVHGGNYGSRLRLVRLPACALTTPDIAACRTRTPLNSVNDTDAQTVSAEVTLAGGESIAGRSASAAAPPMLLATATDPGSDGGKAGTYAASDLKPSGSWSTGGSTGSFAYGYPITVPPSPGNLAPTVALSYDSGSVDGQTASTQAQASWVGDGWATPRSFIEQTFTSCKDNPEGKASPKKTADLCYAGPILTMSLNGSSVTLVYDKDTNVWKSESDNGETITRVVDATVKHDPGHWVVTTRDGTTYKFGLTNLPGGTSNTPATNSVDTVPVYSPHAGGPCYSAAGFDSSVCDMAWRWNLDYVTDVHGNAMAYYYKQDINYYGRNSGSTMDSYVRDSYLDHIDYGFRDGGAYGTIPNKVLFATDVRCVSGSCKPLNATTKANWHDVPYDLVCAKNATCGASGPSFFSTVRLTSITTQQYNTTAAKHKPVDTYALAQTMPATGDGTSPTLWLSSITRTGYGTAANGADTSITLPPVSFTGIKLANRVAARDGLPAFYRHRIETISTETGSVITASYELPKRCTSTTLNPATNTNSCYPIRWTPDGFTAPIVDWFHKYAVTRVTATDPTGGAPATSTSYAYLGGAAWHYDDNELVKAKHRSYGQFRGYATVQTFTGDGVNDRRTKAETSYYRGMSKNNNSTVAKVKDSLGGEHEDVEELAGSVLETSSYQGEGGPLDSSQITAYWVSAATATRTRDGLPALTANTVAAALTLNRHRVTSTTGTSWRYQQTDNSYDADLKSPTFGVLKASYSHTVPANAAYDRCTTNTYARTDKNTPLVGLVSQTETVSKACGGFTQHTPASVPASLNTLTVPATVSRPAQVVSHSRVFYDDNTFSDTFPQPAAPKRGLVTMTQSAKDHTSGAYKYQTTSRKTYDDHGRVRKVYDGNSHVTESSYTTNSAGLITGISVKQPLGHVTSTTLSTPRGLVVTLTDINDVVTTQQFDALGRTTGVWLRNRATTKPAHHKFGYTVSKTGITATTSERANDFSGYIKSVTLYDAQLRQRQTQTMTPQSGRLVTDTFYDTRGWVDTTYNGWWDPKTTPTVGAPVSAANLKVKVPNQTFTTYDGLGRVVIVEQAENAVTVSKTTTVHNGDRTTVIPPTGGTVTTTATDPLGRTQSLTQYQVRPQLSTPGDTFTGTFTINAPLPADDTTVSTSYGYDEHGNQNTVTDVDSNTWTTRHNLLGQVTSRTDPDAGETKDMAYDGNGNLLQTTDARSKTVSHTYDALNRQTGSYAAPIDAQNTTNQLTSKVYDNADNAVVGMAYPKGHLTTATSFNGGQAYKLQARGFNVFGKSIGETTTIPESEDTLAGDYTVAHQYTDNNGLILKDIYPAKGGLPSETVLHSYDAFDLPDTLGGRGAYSQGVIHDAYGRITQQTIGSEPNVADITSAYDEHTGRLTQQLVTRKPTTPANVDQQNYKYDLAGNLIRHTSTRHAANGIGETQCFGYDELRRLTEAWTGTDNCTAQPTPGNRSTVGNTIAGGSAYWTSWTVDNLGNRTEQIQRALAPGTADTTTTYKYDGNGAGQPHTLTSTNTTGATPGTTGYTYDNAGNTITRVPGTDAQTLTWDDTGKLATVTTTEGTSTHVYGPDGDLLLQKDPGTTTLYLGSQQYALDTNTKAVTGTRYYALPGGGTAIRTGTSYTFALAGLHGTPTLYLDSTVQKPTWRQYTPYGAPRGADITIPDNRGFLNKTVNAATGLVHVGAREYDAAIGRFISVDPLQDLTDPQQWNGYAYANNNPTTFSDPTGLAVDTGNGSGNGQRINPKNGQVLDNGQNKGSPGISAGGGTTTGGGGSGGANNGSGSGGSCSTCDTVKDVVKDYYTGMWNQGSGAVTGTWNMVSEAGKCWWEQHGNPMCSPVNQLIVSLVTDPAGTADGMWEGLTHDILSDWNDGNKAGAAGRAGFTVIEFVLGGKGLGKVGKFGSCHSFAAGTLVLLADGSVRAIDKLQVGDVVLATDPTTGETVGKPVTALHLNEDAELTDLILAVSGGNEARIETTWHHPFWSITRRQWVDAADLLIGEVLQGERGRSSTVAGVTNRKGAQRMHDLTVADIHTYYVLAGNTPVLVHNCGGAIVDPGKYDYMFGNVASNSHNAARSAQNAAQFGRVGVYNNAEGRALLQSHFDEVVGSDSNVMRTFSNEHGEFQIRDSLFAGPGGFLHLESTWQVTNDGLRLTTVIPRGGQ